MNLESSFSLNGDLVMSVSQLREIYCWGVRVQNGEGVELPDSIYEFYKKGYEVGNKLKEMFEIKS